MDRLWSPWRMEYILASKDDPDDAGCVFCRIRDGEQEERVLARADLAYVTLNRYPYSPGHVLVIPNRHVGEVEGLTDEETLALQRLLQRSVAALREEYGPHGFNVGMNLGRVAGAGVPDHLHWHVVPRWSADTSFMPVVGQTIVLPELVEETARRLAPRFVQERS
ncbi:MAG TPA: HIT domain-containing protein [Actinomycetota bacterium]|nr:HIT domain-containing protein [Actinomycetota bacterium]